MNTQEVFGDDAVVWWLVSLLATAAVIGVVRLLTPKPKESHWKPVRAAVLQHELLHYTAVPSLTLKLWVAMLVVRATMRQEQARAALNAAAAHAPWHEPWTSWLFRRVGRRVNKQSAAAAAPERAVEKRGGILPTTAVKFCHTWRPVEDDNYDAYLRAVGLSWSLRKLAATMRPEPTFSIEGGVLHSRTPGLGGQVMQLDLKFRERSNGNSLAVGLEAWEAPKISIHPACIASSCILLGSRRCTTSSRQAPRRR